MYPYATSASITSLRFFVVCAVLLLAATKVGYGQRVYANGYGASQSGPGLLGVLSSGLVTNPGNAIEPNSLNTTYTQISVGGLLGNAYAIYQIEFIHNEGNLPAGTSVYIRLDNNTNVGLLNLALASAGFASAYQNANSNNAYTLTGTEVPLNEGEIETPLIGGQQYLKITPSQCFNALRFSITSQGLLGLLATGNIRIYHAYYECPPAISIQNQVICSGESATLQINNPIPASSCDYRWYNSASGGTLLGTGPSYTTPTLSTASTYYVGYSGVDASLCGRTPVTVTVNPLPSIAINPNIDACQQDIIAPLIYTNTGNNPTTYSIDWDPGAVAQGFADVSSISIPSPTSGAISIDIPPTIAIGTYQGLLTVKNANDCTGSGQTITLIIHPKPPPPDISIQ